MKTLSFGWEVDQMDGNTGTLIVPILKNIIIRGYEVDVSYMATTSPLPIPFLNRWLHRNPGFAEILASGSAPVAGPHAFSTGTVSPKAGAHGGAGPGGLFSLILKGWVPYGNAGAGFGRNAAMSGLNIAVAAGTSLTFFMGHAGYPGDAEMQGVLYYDEA